MIHVMRLQAQPFDLIEKGHKTIELRLFDEKRKTIALGDTMLFSHMDTPERTMAVTVKALHIFDSFEQLYASLPLERCGYLPEEVSGAKASDMQIYYSLEEQKRFGVVGIEIERQ